MLTKPGTVLSILTLCRFRPEVIIQSSLIISECLRNEQRHIHNYNNQKENIVFDRYQEINITCHEWIGILINKYVSYFGGSDACLAVFVPVRRKDAKVHLAVIGAHV